MRKAYLDNIRFSTIMLVLVFHVFFFFSNIGIAGIFPGWAPYQPGYFRWEGVYEYAVYPWFMTLLFVVAGSAAYPALQKISDGAFLKARAHKLLLPSVVSVLLLGWLPGSIVVKQSAGNALDAVPGPIKWIIYTCSGIGALWFCQVLFVACLLLVLVRRLDRGGGLAALGGKAGPGFGVTLFFLLWGAGNIGNVPLVESYRMGIYLFAFLVGYYVFSQEKFLALLKKYWAVTAAGAVLSGAVFVATGYGRYYGAALLGGWQASLFTFFSVLAVYGTFQKWFDGSNRVTAFCSKISWPVYILHIPVYLVCLKIMLGLGWPVWAQYPVLLAAGFVVSPCLALLLGKIPGVRVLLFGYQRKGERYNGKTISKG